MSISRWLAVIVAALGVLFPARTEAQPRTPEEAAVIRTDSLRQQLTHVANRRSITPCEAYSRFHTVRPFDGALDPWGRPIEFECRQGVLLVRSVGADGQSGTGDDIVSGKAPPEPVETTKASASDSVSRDERGPTRLTIGAAVLALVAAIAAWVVVQDLRT